MRGVSVFNDGVATGYKSFCFLDGVWMGEPVTEIEGYGFVVCGGRDGGCVGEGESSTGEAGCLEEVFAWFACKGDGCCEGSAGWDVHGGSCLEGNCLLWVMVEKMVEA